MVIKETQFVFNDTDVNQSVAFTKIVSVLGYGMGKTLTLYMVFQNIMGEIVLLKAVMCSLQMKTIRDMPQFFLM